MRDDRELIRDVTFTAASEADRAMGLLGFVRCVYGGLRIDGVTVRRTLGGRITLSFPSRRDRVGQTHDIVRPVDAKARAAIEAAVLQALPGVQEGRA